MRLKSVIIFSMVCGLSACTTVDLSEMASQNSFAKTTVEKNVVERSVGRLYSAFTRKGWCTRTSRNRLQGTAQVLLKGLENAKLSAPSQGVTYNVEPKPFTVIVTDIAQAQTHVDQTVRAAEVYLEMAAADTDLKQELIGLERALLASREAKTTFDTALSAHSEASDTTILDLYSASVEDLRSVTDIYGERVRENNRSQMSTASTRS